MPSFHWTPPKRRAAAMLAEGYTIDETAADVGVNEKTVRRWKADIEFLTETNRLALEVGIASRAERIRIAQRVVRQKLRASNLSDRDLLEWLKYSQGETDGIKQTVDHTFNYDGLLAKLFPDDPETGPATDLEQPDAG